MNRSKTLLLGKFSASTLLILISNKVKITTVENQKSVLVFDRVGNMVNVCEEKKIKVPLILLDPTQPTICYGFLRLDGMVYPFLITKDYEGMVDFLNHASRGKIGTITLTSLDQEKPSVLIGEKQLRENSDPLIYSSTYSCDLVSTISQKKNVFLEMEGTSTEDGVECHKIVNISCFSYRDKWYTVKNGVTGRLTMTFAPTEPGTYHGHHLKLGQFLIFSQVYNIFTCKIKSQTVSISGTCEPSLYDLD